MVDSKWQNMTSENRSPQNRHGRVFQINTSEGGVPKLGRGHAEVGITGILGDRQKTPNVHGGPERALCLYSLENILAIQAEGHPIYPGAIGENVTVSALDWRLVVPDARMRLGEEVLIEFTRFTSPCNTIADAFKDKDYSRVSETIYPGWSRIYARVIQPGIIQVGDFVELIDRL